MSDTTPMIPDTEARLAALAQRHRSAASLGMQVLNLIGAQAGNLLEKLPDRAKDQLEEATGRALETALGLAGKSRGMVPDQQDWLTTAMATAMGAAGGAGGLPSALAELPVTVTVLLRAIQAIAVKHGFDPDRPEIARECLAVFANAGPLEADDSAELSFLAARVTLTGATVQGLIARVAPRLATVLGQKLAAQAVPIIGAAAGAATNYAYTRYYQQMAHVHFGLMALARDTGQDRDSLNLALRDRLLNKPLKRS